MSHPDEGVLQELLDRELAPADEAVVRAHVAGCAPCTTALAALEAMRADADAIVSRLDLDPPLAVRPVHRARRARPDLRMLGLAASAVLVAGTSWLLFRSPNAAQRPEGADTSSGIILPLPAPEREEVAATTASAPRDMGSVATPAEKKEAGDEADRLVMAPEANAARPATAMAPPAAAARLAADAPPPAYTTVAGAEARLGTKVRTIAGLTPVSVEVLPLTADSLLAVRQRYVVSGVPVVLVQQVSTAVPHHMGDVKDLPEDRPGSDYASGGLAGAQPASRTWEAWGSLFQLRGALSADSIDALMKRVR